MLSMENSQNVPKNRFIIKLANYLTPAEKYLGVVLGSEQSYQFDLNSTFISNFFTTFNSITFIHTNDIHFKYFQIRANISNQPKITVLFRLLN